MGITALTEPRFPHFEQTRPPCHSGIGVSAPYRRARSAGSGSTRCRQSRHQTSIRAYADAVLPSVAGGPGWDFICSFDTCRSRDEQRRDTAPARSRRTRHTRDRRTVRLGLSRPLR
jgi:hypothetical protein